MYRNHRSPAAPVFCVESMTHKTLKNTIAAFATFEIRAFLSSFDLELSNRYLSSLSPVFVLRRLDGKKARSFPFWTGHRTFGSWRIFIDLGMRPSCERRNVEGSATSQHEEDEYRCHTASFGTEPSQTW
jgi:hypothetical protein